LLVADARLPSVATLVVGAPVRGSWWGHPAGKDIYAVCSLLDTHPESGDARLVSGKITYVHRRLWSALVAVGTAREPWQTAGLSPLALRLLALLLEDGEARTDDLDELGMPSRKLLGAAARELEAVLLARGEGLHTSDGTHAKRLETWTHWAVRRGLRETLPSAAEGKRLLEQALARINAQYEARGRLPWSGVLTAGSGDS
jgi:hypothetical protein